jgi:hypothetical protein
MKASVKSIWGGAGKMGSWAVSLGPLPVPLINLLILKKIYAPLFILATRLPRHYNPVESLILPHPILPEKEFPHVGFKPSRPDGNIQG